MNRVEHPAEGIPNQPLSDATARAIVGVKNDAIQCERITLDFQSKRSATRSSANTREEARPAQGVLNDLNLSVPAGRIVSLLGASGCGKSTLLRIIAGLQRPDSGRVLLHGRPRSHSHTSTADGDNLSFVFQEAALLPWRTVRENVMLPLELHGTQALTERVAQVEQWLRIVGLEPKDWRKKPNQLSGGMKMRASIARSMVTSPDILLMDEPFAALDDVLRSKLCDLVLEIVASKKCAVLFVTHNIAEAVYLSDRIDVMAAGRIATSQSISFQCDRNAELRSTPEFVQFYADAAQALFQNSKGAM